MRVFISKSIVQCFCLFVLLCFVTAAGCSSGESGPPPRPTPIVKVAKPLVKTSVQWDAYTGRLEPVSYVEVRARVTGYLDSIHFEEGAIVNKGDLLFIIDPRPFKAELSSAKATLGQAESQLDQANSGLAVAEANLSQTEAMQNLSKTRAGRARELMKRQATSQEELDQREAEFLEAKANSTASEAGIQSAMSQIASAKAAIDSAKAGVAMAELNLDFTHVTAPISGRISREYVNAGNLVRGGATDVTVLTTITSVEPIYCTFDANEQEVLKYMRLAKDGTRKSSREFKNPAFLGLIDEDGFPHEGHMDFVDNQFDPATASMRGRCVFRNKDKILIPGMFARIRIPGSATEQTVLIPDSAVGTDQSSQYVFVVVDDKIERRPVTLGPLVDGLRVVKTGLEGNESLVIEGLLLARPGASVKTEPGTIEAVDDGLPDEYEPLPPEQWITTNTSNENGT